MFEKLASSGVLSREVVERAKRMKGFRNILVRRYRYVDDRL
ncbi:HepT-like ribonuclease domain-containing protein [Methanothrix thermoacetophila]